MCIALIQQYIHDDKQSGSNHEGPASTATLSQLTVNSAVPQLSKIESKGASNKMFEKTSSEAMVQPIQAPIPVDEESDVKPEDDCDSSTNRNFLNSTGLWRHVESSNPVARFVLPTKRKSLTGKREPSRDFFTPKTSKVSNLIESDDDDDEYGGKRSNFQSNRKPDFPLSIDASESSDAAMLHYPSFPRCQPTTTLTKFTEAKDSVTDFVPPQTTTQVTYPTACILFPCITFVDLKCIHTQVVEVDTLDDKFEKSEVGEVGIASEESEVLNLMSDEEDQDKSGSPLLKVKYLCSALANKRRTQERT